MQRLIVHETRTSPTSWALTGLAIGVMVGFGGWSTSMHRYRRALFHPSAVRRMAAIGYLRGRPSVDSARLLRDYLAWEANPVLRRRARRALHRVEHSLDAP